jgi:hypothetical protein
MFVAIQGDSAPGSAPPESTPLSSASRSRLWRYVARIHFLGFNCDWWNPVIDRGKARRTPRRARSGLRAPASAYATKRLERVDHIHICVSAEPDVPAVDPPYSVLPHQRNEVRVGHVVSTRLVAARLTE